MTNDEIREAISATKEIAKWLDGDGNERHYKILVALAEEYLKVEGWPEEEQEEHYCEAGSVKCGACIQDEVNISIRLCRLAATKEKRGLSEGIRDIIAQPIDRISEITVESYEQIRQKLLKLINGKEA